MSLPLTSGAIDAMVPRSGAEAGAIVRHAGLDATAMCIQVVHRPLKPIPLRLSELGYTVTLHQTAA